QEVLVDVSAFADGQQHNLTLQANTLGGAATSFFVDDVSLIAGPPVATAIEVDLGNAEIVQDQDFGFWTPNQPPQVVSVEVNTDQIDPPDLAKGVQPTTWAVQRSMVRTVVVTFDEDVSADETGFRFTNLGVNADSDPNVAVAILPSQVTVVDNVVTLLFDGDNVLEEGVYQLDVLPTVVDIFGAQLDGDGNGVGGDEHTTVGSEENALFALTAEWNGDGGVSVFDFSTFSYWFGSAVGPNGAPHYADNSGDAGVSVFDFSGFSVNFGKSIAFPAAFAAMQLTPPAAILDQHGAVEGSAVEGSAVEGSAVEGGAVEGSAVEGSAAVDGEFALIRRDNPLFGTLAPPAAREELPLKVAAEAVDQALLELIDVEF
ncbi:MAG: hypothetical protein ACI9G1_004212, partial [Pirellulaceae bacterium]